MPTPFCPRCYEVLLARFKERHAKNIGAKLDPTKCNFACKVPIYESDKSGRPTVKIFDCEKNTFVTYPQSEWERRKLNGEIK